MNLSLLMTIAGLLTGQELEREWHFDFRGQPLSAHVRLIGPNAKQAIKEEAAGLRVIPPTNSQQTKGWGVALNRIRVTGDFEITGVYELLTLDTPSEGMVAGVSLSVAPSSQRMKFAKIGRFRGSDTDDVYIADYFAKEPAAVLQREMPPAHTQSGKLRLQRQGGTLHFLVADSQGGDFREVMQAEYGSGDIDEVLFIANNNISPTIVDARLLSLDVRFGAGELEPLQPPAKAGVTQVYFLPLKGKPPQERSVRQFGPDAEQCVRFEAEGLRIKLPPAFPGERPYTGLKTTVHIPGDFEISVRFDIVKEPAIENTGKRATRFGLIAVAGDAQETQTGFVCRMAAAGGPQVSTWLISKEAKELGKNPFKFKYFNRTANSGRLRLVRTGPVVAYHLAEGNGPYVLLNEIVFTDAALTEVQLAGGTGGPEADLDVRFTDLHIRSGPPSEPPPPALERAGSRLLVLLLAASLLGTLAAGLWFWRRRARAPQSTSTALAVTCAGCGKTLKVKSQYAGKKLVCPQCGEGIMLPRFPT